MKKNLFFLGFYLCSCLVILMLFFILKVKEIDRNVKQILLKTNCVENDVLTTHKPPINYSYKTEQFITLEESINP